jgi:3-deoxy-manno-octulosonate cytidylyltransferase (CMP-KDO synthetase)
MKILGVIPARYASTRFPGKPLALISGKPMIQHVYEKVSATAIINYATVATDDKRIFDAVISFGGNAIMTSSSHPNGTSRCHETVNILENKNMHFDAVINIQGDEPFIKPRQIELVAKQFRNQDIQIATLAKKLENQDELFSPNVVKVVFDNNFKALYFSRNPVPFVRNKDKQEWMKNHTFYKHIGIYGFRKDILKKLTRLPESKLEKAENLEQLRWIENGYSINLEITDMESFGIDTPEDLTKLTNNSWKF